MRVASPVESVLRAYLLAETKRRLHQPVFASQVMRAYETRCAVWLAMGTGLARPLRMI